MFMKTPWPILSDDKYSFIEESWKLAIEAQDWLQAVEAASVCRLSLCPLRSGPSLKIDPQMRDTVT